MGRGEQGAAAALLGRLEGRWSLAREIDDRLSGLPARFEGEAVFERRGGGLRYRETGLLHVSGQAAMRAERGHEWRALGGWVEVLFEDGRAFHRFAAADRAVARHDCAPDVYEVRYDFAQAHEWQAVWHVSGPRKAYRMLSRYARA